MTGFVYMCGFSPMCRFSPINVWVCCIKVRYVVFTVVFTNFVLTKVRVVKKQMT